MTLNHEKLNYSENKNLPPLWHWLYFLPIFRLSEAGYDGHAALGDFLPPVQLPRRMCIEADRLSPEIPS